MISESLMWDELTFLFQSNLIKLHLYKFSITVEVFMKNRILILFVFFLMFGTTLRAQDVILYGGYVTSEESTFKRGWNVGLIGRYDFSEKFSQDLGVTYAHTAFDELYLPSTGLTGFHREHTNLISIRTHSVFNLIKTENTRFSTGIGPCVNFFGTTSEVMDGAVNAGIALLLGYETHSFMKSPWGFFTRARFEYDPKLADQDPYHYSPFKEDFSSFELNVGVIYTIKKKGE